MMANFVVFKSALGALTEAHTKPSCGRRPLQPQLLEEAPKRAFLVPRSLLLQRSGSGLFYCRQPVSLRVAAMAARTKSTVTSLELQQVLLTGDQLSKAKAAMDRFIQSVATTERREGAAPYYLLHKEGERVYGTVLMFHGFSSTVGQMKLLAQYLFENGFNVYQPALYGHYFINPDKNWAQTDMRPEWKEKIGELLMAYPNLPATLKGLKSISTITPEEVNTVFSSLTMLPKAEREIIDAVNDTEYTESFYRFFESNHLHYLHHGEARLKEVEALPGPIFTVGLSMGGSTALAVAAKHPEKISKTVAFAPLLKVVNDMNRRFSLIAGPLGVKESGWYPEMPFTLSCLSAVDVFGHSVRSKANVDVLTKMPTFLVLTENDDSAYVPTSLHFAQALLSHSDKNGPPHLSAIYSKSEMVPHPMINPAEVSQGMTNCYWTTLYQETFRFLTQGTANLDKLHSLSQDPGLPQVAPL